MGTRSFTRNYIFSTNIGIFKTIQPASVNPHTSKPNIFQLPKSRTCISTLLAVIWAKILHNLAERPSLQDEDYSRRRPHSFPALGQVRSGVSPGWIRSGPELAGSGEIHHVGIVSQHTCEACGQPLPQRKTP